MTENNILKQYSIKIGADTTELIKELNRVEGELTKKLSKVDLGAGVRNSLNKTLQEIKLVKTKITEQSKQMENSFSNIGNKLSVDEIEKKFTGLSDTVSKTVDTLNATLGSLEESVVALNSRDFSKLNGQITENMNQINESIGNVLGKISDLGVGIQEYQRLVDELRDGKITLPTVEDNNSGKKLKKKENELDELVKKYASSVDDIEEMLTNADSFDKLGDTKKFREYLILLDQISETFDSLDNKKRLDMGINFDLIKKQRTQINGLYEDAIKSRKRYERELERKNLATNISNTVADKLFKSLEPTEVNGKKTIPIAPIKKAMEEVVKFIETVDFGEGIELKWKTKLDPDVTAEKLEEKLYKQFIDPIQTYLNEPDNELKLHVGLAQESAKKLKNEALKIVQDALVGKLTEKYGNNNVNVVGNVNNAIASQQQEQQSQTPQSSIPMPGRYASQVQQYQGSYGGLNIDATGLAQESTLSKIANIVEKWDSDGITTSIKQRGKTEEEKIIDKAAQALYNVQFGKIRNINVVDEAKARKRNIKRIGYYEQRNEVVQELTSKGNKRLKNKKEILTGSRFYNEGYKAADGKIYAKWAGLGTPVLLEDFQKKLLKVVEDGFVPLTDTEKQKKLSTYNKDKFKSKEWEALENQINQETHTITDWLKKEFIVDIKKIKKDIGVEYKGKRIIDSEHTGTSVGSIYKGYRGDVDKLQKEILEDRIDKDGNITAGLRTEMAKLELLERESDLMRELIRLSETEPDNERIPEITAEIRAMERRVSDQELFNKYLQESIELEKEMDDNGRFERYDDFNRYNELKDLMEELYEEPTGDMVAFARDNVKLIDSTIKEQKKKVQELENVYKEGSQAIVKKFFGENDTYIDSKGNKTKLIVNDDKDYYEKRKELEAGREALAAMKASIFKDGYEDLGALYNKAEIEQYKQLEYRMSNLSKALLFYSEMREKQGRILDGGKIKEYKYKNNKQENEEISNTINEILKPILTSGKTEHEYIKLAKTEELQAIADGLVEVEDRESNIQDNIISVLNERIKYLNSRRQEIENTINDSNLKKLIEEDDEKIKKAEERGEDTTELRKQKENKEKRLSKLTTSRDELLDAVSGLKANLEDVKNKDKLLGMIKSQNNLSDKEFDLLLQIVEKWSERQISKERLSFLDKELSPLKDVDYNNIMDKIDEVFQRNLDIDRDLRIGNGKYDETFAEQAKARNDKEIRELISQLNYLPDSADAQIRDEFEDIIYEMERNKNEYRDLNEQLESEKRMHRNFVENWNPNDKRGEKYFNEQNEKYIRNIRGISGRMTEIRNTIYGENGEGGLEGRKKELLSGYRSNGSADKKYTDELAHNQQLDRELKSLVDEAIGTRNERIKEVLVSKIDELVIGKGLFSERLRDEMIQSLDSLIKAENLGDVGKIFQNQLIGELDKFIENGLRGDELKTKLSNKVKSLINKNFSLGGNNLKNMLKDGVDGLLSNERVSDLMMYRLSPTGRAESNIKVANTSVSDKEIAHRVLGIIANELEGRVKRQDTIQEYKRKEESDRQYRETREKELYDDNIYEKKIESKRRISSINDEIEKNKTILKRLNHDFKEYYIDFNNVSNEAQNLMNLLLNIGHKLDYADSKSLVAKSKRNKIMGDKNASKQDVDSANLKYSVLQTYSSNLESQVRSLFDDNQRNNIGVEVAFARKLRLLELSKLKKIRNEELEKLYKQIDEIKLDNLKKPKSKRKNDDELNKEIERFKARGIEKIDELINNKKKDIKILKDNITFSELHEIADSEFKKISNTLKEKTDKINSTRDSADKDEAEKDYKKYVKENYERRELLAGILEGMGKYETHYLPGEEKSSEAINSIKENIKSLKEEKTQLTSELSTLTSKQKKYSNYDKSIIDKELDGDISLIDERITKLELERNKISSSISDAKKTIDYLDRFLIDTEKRRKSIENDEQNKDVESQLSRDLQYGIDSLNANEELLKKLNEQKYDIDFRIEELNNLKKRSGEKLFDIKYNKVKPEQTTATTAATDAINAETEAVEKNTEAKKKNIQATQQTILDLYGSGQAKHQADAEIIEGILDSTFDEDEFDLENIRRNTKTYRDWENQQRDLQKKIDELNEDSRKLRSSSDNTSDKTISDLEKKLNTAKNDLKRIKGLSENKLEQDIATYEELIPIVEDMYDNPDSYSIDRKKYKDRKSFLEKIDFYRPEKAKERFDESDSLQRIYGTFNKYVSYLQNNLYNTLERWKNEYKYNYDDSNAKNVLSGLKGQITNLENQIADLDARGARDESYAIKRKELEDKLAQKRTELANYQDEYNKYSIEGKENEIAQIQEQLNNAKSRASLNVDSKQEKENKTKINDLRAQKRELEKQEKSIGLDDEEYLKAREEMEKRKQQREQEERERNAHMTAEEKKLANDLFEANGKLINMRKEKNAYTEKEIEDQEQIIRQLEEQVELSERLELHQRGQFNVAQLKSQYRKDYKLSSPIDEPVVDIDPTIPATEKTLVEIRDILYKTIGKDIRPKNTTQEEREHSEFYKKYGVEYNKYLFNQVAKDMGLVKTKPVNGVRVKYIDNKDRNTIALEYARRVKARDAELDKVARELGLYKNNKAGKEYLTQEGRKRAIVEMENRSPGSSMYTRQSIEKYRKEIEKSSSKLTKVDEVERLLKQILEEDEKGNDVSKLFKELSDKYSDLVGSKKKNETEDSLINKIEELTTKIAQADENGEDTTALFEELRKLQGELNSTKLKGDNTQNNVTQEQVGEQTLVAQDADELEKLIQQILIKDALGEDTSELVKQVLQNMSGVLGDVKKRLLDNKNKLKQETDKTGELDKDFYYEVAKKNGWYYEKTKEDGSTHGGVKSDFRSYVYGQMELEKPGSTGYSDEKVKEFVKEYLMYLLAKSRDGALTKAGTTRVASKKELEKELLNIKPGLEGLTEEQVNRAISILNGTTTTLSQVATSGEQATTALSEQATANGQVAETASQTAQTVTEQPSQNPQQIEQQAQIESVTSAINNNTDAINNATAAIDRLTNGDIATGGSSTTATTQTQATVNGSTSESFNNGQEYVENFTEGMESELKHEEEVVEKMSEMPSEKTEETLSIESPSKVMEKLGYYTVEGFAKGIEENADRVSEAMAYLLREGVINEADINDTLKLLDRRKKADKTVGDFIDSKRYDSDEIKTLLQTDIDKYGEFKTSILSHIKDKSMADIAKLIKEDSGFTGLITNAESALQSVTNGRATFEDVLNDIFGKRSHKSASEAYSSAIRRMQVETGSLNESISEVVHNLDNVATESEEAFDPAPIKEQIKTLKGELGSELNVKEKTRKTKKGNKKSYKIEGEGGTATINENGEVAITKKTISDLDNKKRSAAEEKENERKLKETKRAEFQDMVDAAKAVVEAERELNTALNNYKKDNKAFESVLAGARINLDEKKDALAKFDVKGFLDENSKYITKRQRNAYDKAIRDQKVIEDSRLASQQADFNATAQKNREKAEKQHQDRIKQDALELLDIKEKIYNYDLLIERANGNEEKATLKALRSDAESLFKTVYASYGKETISAYEEMLSDVERKHSEKLSLISAKKEDNKTVKDAKELLALQKEIFDYEVLISKTNGENEKEMLNSILARRKEQFSKLFDNADKDTIKYFNEGYGNLSVKYKERLNLVEQRNKDKLEKEQKKYITTRTEKGLWLDFNAENMERAFAEGATATFKDQKSDTIWQGELFKVEVEKLISAVQAVVNAEIEVDKAYKDYLEKGDAYADRLREAEDERSRVFGEYKNLNPVEFFNGNKEGFSEDQLDRYAGAIEKHEKILLNRQDNFDKFVENVISSADKISKATNISESYKNTNDEKLYRYDNDGKVKRYSNGIAETIKGDLYDKLQESRNELNEILYDEDGNLNNIVDEKTLIRVRELTSNIKNIATQMMLINDQESIDSAIDAANSNVEQIISRVGMYNSKEYDDLVLKALSARQSLNNLNRDDNGLLSENEIENAEKYLTIIKNIEKESKNITPLASDIAKSKVSAQMSDYMRKNTKVSSRRRSQLEILLNQLNSKNLDQQGLRNIIQRFNELKTEISQAGEAGKGFAAIFNTKMVHTIAAQVAQMFSFYSIINRMRSAVTTIMDLDTALVDLQKTTKMNTDQLNDFYFEANNIARQMGVTTKEIIEQASAWSRLGYNTKETSEMMAELSSQFASISPGMDINNATDGLVSSMKAFNIEVEDVERKIMDNINRIGNTAATSNSEIVDMLTRSSAAMAAANNSIEETIALETAAVEITRNAETTGTAFKTIAMRIRGYDEETEELSEDLEDISGDIADLTKVAGKGGISLFTDDSKQTYKSTYQILKEISEIWDQLSDKNQAELLEKLAGKRGGQVVAGLLTNFDAAEKAIKEMDKAAGSSDEEMEIIRKSIAYKMNNLKETWVGTFQEIIGRDDIGTVVSALTALSSALSNVIKTVGSLGTVGSVVGAILGFRNAGFIRTYNVGNDDGTSRLKLGTVFGQRRQITENYNKKIADNAKYLEEAKQTLPKLQNSFDSGINRVEVYKEQIDDVSGAFHNLSDELKHFVMQNLDSEDLMTEFAKQNYEVAESLEKEKQEVISTSSALNNFKKIARVDIESLVDMGIGFLIGLATDFIGQVANATDTIREKAKEAGKSIKETSESVEDYKKEIKDLYKVLNDKSSTDDEIIQARTNLIDLQKTMIEQFGDETDKVKAITDATLGYVDALDQLTESQYWQSRNKFNEESKPEWVKNRINGYSDNIDRMRKQYLADRMEYITLDRVNADLGKIDQEMVDELNKIGVSVMKQKTTLGFNSYINTFIKKNAGEYAGATSAENFAKVMDNASFNLEEFDPLTDKLTSADKIVLQFNGNAKDLNETLLQMQDIFGRDESFKKLTSQIGELQQKYADIISANEEFAKQYVRNELVYNSNDGLDLEKRFGNITDIVKDYNEAFKKGDKKGMDVATANYINSLHDSFEYIELQVLNGKLSREDADAIEDYIQNVYGEQMQGAIDNLKLHIDISKILYPEFSKDEINKVRDKVNKEDILEVINLDDLYKEGGKDLHETVNNAMDSVRAKLIEEGFDIADDFNPDNLDGAIKEEFDNAIKDVASELGMTSEQFLNTYNSSILGIDKLVEFCKENGYEVEKVLDELGFKSREVAEEQKDITANTVTKVNEARKSLESLYGSLEKYKTGKLVGGDYLDVLEDVLKEDSSFLEGANNIGDVLQNAINKKLEDTKKTIQEKAPELLTVWNEAIEKAQFTSKLQETNSEIDKLQEGMKTLSSAFDEYNQKGYITIDTLQSLMNEDENYIQMLTVEGGKIKINMELYKQQVAEKLKDFKASLDQAAAKEIDALATEDSSTQIKNNTDLLKDNSIALDENTKLATINALERGAKKEDINRIISKYDAIYNAALKGYSKNFKDTMGLTTESGKESLDKFIALQDALLDAGKISFQDYCKNVKGKLDELYKSGKITAQEYFDSIKTFLEKQQSIYDKVLSAIEKRIDKEIEGIDKQITAINKENEALDKQKEEYDKILSVVQEVYDNEIKSLNDQKDAIQEKIDALRDANDEEDRALALANARYALEKAQQQRTRLVYSGEQGFVYKQDEEAIRSAKKELKQAELDNTISLLEKEQEALDKDIEKLEEYKEKWSEVGDTYDKEVNRQLAIQMYGENYEQIILQNREQDIKDFTDKYVALQKKQNDNSELIKSLEEKKEYYEELKKQWQEITSVYEDNINKQYADQVLGANWEAEVLAGRVKTLEDFKNSYISIQEQIKQAAIDSANAQAKAAGSGSTEGIDDGLDSNPDQKRIRMVTYVESTNGVVKDYETNNDSKSSSEKEANDYIRFHAKDLYNADTKVKTEIISGYGVYDEKDKNYTKQVQRFDTLDEAMKFVEENQRANRKWKIRAIQAFSKGGVISANSNKSPLTELANRFGEDTPILAKHGERILTPVQNKYWEKWTNALPNLTKNIDALKFNIPNFGSILGAIANKETTVKQEISISLPNVTNNSGAEYVINALKTLPLEAVQRVNRR